ncbi:MAG: ATP-binding protein, partial [Clostridia bacterium]
IAATERERHDFRHHYVAIRDIVNCGDIQKAQEYFNQYDSAYPLRKPLLVCHNAMLNAILSHYLDNATQGGVKVTCAVNIPQAIGIDTLELGVVMGNLVENAVEATLRQGDAADKFVDIKTNIVGQQLVAIIANSYDGRIKNENGEYLSSKRINKVGIGIDSVKKLVAKNGGNLKIEYDEKVFTAAVALNIC